MSLDLFGKSKNASLHYFYLANWESPNERFVVEEVNKLSSSQDICAILSSQIYYTLHQELEFY